MYVLLGSMALTGWKRMLRNNGYSYCQATKLPTVDCLLPLISEDKLNQFIDVLFKFNNAANIDFMLHGKLRPMGHVMLAMELMSYENNVEKYGRNHFVHKGLLQVVVSVGLTQTIVDAHNLVISWGSLVKAEWLADNAIFCDDESKLEGIHRALEGLVDAQKHERDMLSKHMKIQSTQIDRLTTELKESKNVIFSLQGLVSDLYRLQGVNNTSPRKRIAIERLNSQGNLQYILLYIKYLRVQIMYTCTNYVHVYIFLHMYTF